MKFFRNSRYNATTLCCVALGNTSNDYLGGARHRLQMIVCQLYFHALPMQAF